MYNFIKSKVTDMSKLMPENIKHDVGNLINNGGNYINNGLNKFKDELHLESLPYYSNK